MKETVKAINTSYYLALGGAILSAIIGYILMKLGITINELSQTGIIISTIMILLTVGPVPLTLAVFHFQTKKWIALKSRTLKLKKYKKGGVLRIAILGTGLSLGLLSIFVLESKSMIFCSAIAAIGLFFSKPNDVRISYELELEV